MKITLVNPPRTLIDRSEIAPPLGLLRLAGAGLFGGSKVSLIDFNLLYHIDPRLSEPDRFYPAALERLLEEEADAYCFTSMAVDTHVAVHLARLLKEERPEVRVVAGGTHFAAIAADVMNVYPWIDLVVTGEGEDVIRRLPELLRQKTRHSVIKGMPFKSDESEGVPFQIVEPELYFQVNPNGSFDFESGRGCRFKCAFCYSPGHYDGFRNFSEDRIIAELKEAGRLGFKNVFFVEDNFLNDQQRAQKFCRELEQARLGLSWHCYATFPQLSSEIISAMAAAGCVAVFAGIDAVGRDSRRAYRKAFVRESDVLGARIKNCVKNGITPTCAFLLSPPSRPGGCDLEETLYFALIAKNAGAHVRLNTLTLYNQTRSALESTGYADYDDFKVRLMLDVPEIVETNMYASNRPDLYPFHSRYVGEQEWRDFISLVHCLFTLFETYPETLSQLWDEKGVSPFKIACTVLSNIAPLLDIPKIERRDVELLEAIKVLQKEALCNRGVQAVLEKESSSILSFHYA